MDIFIKTDLDKCKQIFSELGFQIKDKKYYFDAEQKTRFGRYHVHFIEKDSTVYADFHYDFVVHFMFLGVFHKKFAFKFFQKYFVQKFFENKIDYRITLTNYFTRKNKAILWGMKV